jgi:hypothetical protein
MNLRTILYIILFTFILLMCGILSHPLYEIGGGIER